MNLPDYSLHPADEATLKRSRRWLLLGVAALGIAGIFAGLLANTKNPLFYTELVVHVDLSVLVWFLTMAGMLFTLALGSRAIGVVTDAAFYAFAAGTALIIASAFTGGTPYMSNYIPVIYHPVFFLGLGLLLGAMLLMATQVVMLLRYDLTNIVRYAVQCGAYITLVSALCFAMSVRGLPSDLTGQIYYEYAFWGGGHVLQFVHTQLMMAAWLWLASVAGVKMRFSKKTLLAIFSINFLIQPIALFLYLRYAVLSDEHKQGFTTMMRDWNGVAPLFLGLCILWYFFKPPPPTKPASQTERNAGTLPFICFLMSFLLFAAGGGLGYYISGSNLVVPAHYHGSIIGITIAFMGISYLLLPQFGFADVSRWKLAKLQPVIYGGGMLCWMLGMAVLGAHGVSRKTPGSADSMGKFVEFLKHGSDGLALIGGLLFVFIVLRAAWNARKEKANKNENI